MHKVLTLKFSLNKHALFTHLQMNILIYLNLYCREIGHLKAKKSLS